MEPKSCRNSHKRPRRWQHQPGSGQPSLSWEHEYASRLPPRSSGTGLTESNRDTVARCVNAPGNYSGIRAWYPLAVVESRTIDCLILMLDNDSRTTRKSLHVNANAGDEAVVDVFQALASATRVSILRYLGDRVVAVNQIAQDLGLKSSTATMHITILERA